MWNRLIASLFAAVVMMPPMVVAQAPVSAPTVTPADIRFMQDMIGHHRQAVEMSALVAARTRRPQLRTLAERITISQADEMAMMRQWLRSHGASDTAATHDMRTHDGHDMGAMPSMPGMLTSSQLQALRTARGTRFDRLFLEGMIRHHEGALTMVRHLLEQGAAQESSINRFVTDVDADQRAEIARMRQLLGALR